MSFESKMPNKKIYLKYYFKGVFYAVLRKIIGRSKFTLKKYNGKEILNLKLGNDYIRENLNKNEPFMAGRFGDSELRNVVYYLNKRFGLNKEYPDYIKTAITRNAGLFPRTDDTMDKFAEKMLESCESADVLAVWFNLMEGFVYYNFGPKEKTCIYLKSLEPFWFENPWTSALEGKKILVIHPFEETIQAQYKKREYLFENPKILPQFHLLTLKAVQSIGGCSNDFTTWFDALDWMYTQAMLIDFDIALIGCGAYGFPLAAKLKKCGKIAIHLGGVTQLLFGIKGGRWDKRPDYVALYNEYWCRPLESETPKEANLIENSCYW